MVLTLGLVTLCLEVVANIARYRQSYDNLHSTKRALERRTKDYIITYCQSEQPLSAIEVRSQGKWRSVCSVELRVLQNRYWRISTNSPFTIMGKVVNMGPLVVVLFK